MKKLLLLTLLAAILAFALQVQPARAADSTNIAVRIVETNTTITYYMQFTFLGTGTDSRFTRAINVSELDLTTAQFSFNGNGVGSIDIDLSIHSGAQVEAVTTKDSTGASNTLDLSDLLKVAAVSNRQALGAVVTTHDTLSVVAEVEHQRAQWFVFEADGQTGNPTTATLSVGFHCIKRTNATARAFRQYSLILDTK